MVLTGCPDCNGGVSPSAVTCPHCGFPLNGTANPTSLHPAGRSDSNPPAVLLKVMCSCGRIYELPRVEAGRTFACAACGRPVKTVGIEPIPAVVGAGVSSYKSPTVRRTVQPIPSPSGGSILIVTGAGVALLLFFLVARQTRSGSESNGPQSASPSAASNKIPRDEGSNPSKETDAPALKEEQEAIAKVWDFKSRVDAARVKGNLAEKQK